MLNLFLRNRVRHNFFIGASRAFFLAQVQESSSPVSRFDLYRGVDAKVCLLEVYLGRGCDHMRHMTARLSPHHDLYPVAVVSHFRGETCKEHVALLHLVADVWAKHFKRNLPAFLPPAQVVEKPGPLSSWYSSCFHGGLRHLQPNLRSDRETMAALFMPTFFPELTGV